MSKRESQRRADIGHHTARQNIESSTTRERKAQGGTLICVRCLATHHDKHWYTQDESLKKDIPAAAEETLCPGCFRIENNIWQGTVELEGEFEASERKEIDALILHVESECWQDNPASRILSKEEEDSKLTIKTTTVWLAKRIGKQLEKTFKGALEIKPSPEKETVYVHWRKCQASAAAK